MENMNKATEYKFDNYGNLHILGARIPYKLRNFAGRARPPYNPEGVRNFCVILDEDLGHELENSGWNVKWFTPRKEGDVPTPYISVAVSYDNIPPKVTARSRTGEVAYNDTMISAFDKADFSYVGVTIHPRRWLDDRSGRERVKAYLKNMYVVFNEEDADMRDEYYRYSGMPIPDNSMNPEDDPF